MKSRVVLLGPPASGKGTQAALLSASFGIPHASTGAMLREENARGSEIGVEAECYTRDGRLFPDALAMKVVWRWLDDHGRFILDGFPRTLGQAHSFDAGLKERKLPLDVVFLLELSEPAIRERLASRLTCSACGAVFSETFHQLAPENPCPRCGGKLDRRADDTPEALDERLVQYRELTLPVADHYRSRGLLKEIDVSPGRDAVFQILYNEIIEEAA